MDTEKLTTMSRDAVSAAVRNAMFLAGRATGPALANGAVQRG